MSVDALPRVSRSRQDVRQFVRDAQATGQRVGVVMTMGALHQGHLGLVKACTDQCDVCVVSVFVNPTQFGAGEDFEKYPRDLDADLAQLAGHGVDLVFAPSASEMYRPEHSTVVRPPDVAKRLEAAHRVGHFEGVATIVLKLLHIIPADIACFGQKDYQQCSVIKNMVADLDLPTEIVVCPTVRDHDGLAMSSRNRYLSPAQRSQALTISQSLRHAQTQVADGETSAEQIRARIEAALRQAGIDRIDYVAIADPVSLRPIDQIDKPAVALIACHIGTTRLIDNWILEPS